MSDLYFYKGINIYVNVMGIRDKVLLKIYIVNQFGFVMLNIFKNLLKMESVFDFLELYKLLFENVFLWVG